MSRLRPPTEHDVRARTSRVTSGVLKVPSIVFAQMPPYRPMEDF